MTTTDPDTLPLDDVQPPPTPGLRLTPEGVERVRRRFAGNLTYEDWSAQLDDYIASGRITITQEKR